MAKKNIKIIQFGYMKNVQNLNYQNHNNVLFTLGRMVMIKRQKMANAGKEGKLLQCWWKCILWPLWKTVWKFLKKTENRNFIQFSSSAIGYILKGKETIISNTCTLQVYCSTIHNSQDTESTKVSF